MTVDEIKAKIKNIEVRRWSLQMKDRWLKADWELDAKWEKELKNLNEALANKE